MKASKFTDAQKAFLLKQAEDGVPVGDICRKAGISQATFYAWRKKYAGLTPPEMRRLKALEDENSRLKRLVAELSLDKEMLQDVVRRKLGSPMSLGPLAFHWLTLSSSGSWWLRFRWNGVFPNGGPAWLCWSTAPASNTDRAGPDRSLSRPASRRSARPEFALATDACTSSSTGRDGQ